MIQVSVEQCHIPSRELDILVKDATCCLYEIGIQPVKWSMIWLRGERVLRAALGFPSGRFRLE